MYRGRGTKLPFFLVKSNEFATFFPRYFSQYIIKLIVSGFDKASTPRSEVVPERQIPQGNHQFILLGELNPYGTDRLVAFHIAIFFSYRVPIKGLKLSKMEAEQ